MVCKRYDNAAGFSKSAKYLYCFLSTLLCFVICALFLVRNNMNISGSINFQDLRDDKGEDSILITDGLSRKQRYSIKTEYLKNNSPPVIGLFGNHSFKYFSEEAFGLNKDNDLFFNFIYANLSLRDIRDYLAYMRDIEKLPIETILVQVTAPNNDNGANIIGSRDGELPEEIIGYYTRENDDPKDMFFYVLNEIQSFKMYVDNIFMYSSTYYAFSNMLFNITWDKRVLQVHKCNNVLGSTEYNNIVPKYIIDRLPTFIIFLLSKESHEFCNERFYMRAYQADGSENEIYCKNCKPIINKNPLIREKSKLSYGDERLIAQYIKDIYNIGVSKGKKVVFIIPPVYETDRKDSIPNIILSSALDVLPDEIEVIDHKFFEYRDDNKYFVKYDHPSLEYFRLLVNEMRELGLIQH